jgi:hypothetical protein
MGCSDWKSTPSNRRSSEIRDTTDDRVIQIDSTPLARRLLTVVLRPGTAELHLGIGTAELELGGPRIGPRIGYSRIDGPCGSGIIGIGSSEINDIA